jgi:hypothetical protein
MNTVIDSLVDDLEPIRPLRPVLPAAITAVLTAIIAIATVWALGLREDLFAGEPQAIFLLRSGVLALIGAATFAAVVSAARPGVGKQRDGWKWALGFGAIFPLSMLVLAIVDGGISRAVIEAPSARMCVAVGLIGGIALAAPLTAWLRRGAVVDADRTGWLVGFASGAFALLAYNIHCPSSTVTYIGLWYTSALGLSAIAGRLFVPRFLRW